MDESVKNIANKIDELNHLQYKVMKDEILDILNKKDSNIERIERALDILLTNPLEEAKELFYTLCMYYSLLDDEAAMFYITEYEKEHEVELPKIKRKDY